MKSTPDNTRVNLIAVIAMRGILELPVRQDMHFFYQSRYYLLL